jgi:phosphoribosylanthranilate isomerase
MARVRVKICGITTPDDARLAVEAGADAIGLIFADSPRQVSLNQATHIVAALPPWVAPVGVFVNQAPQDILHIARELRLGAIQFHGDEMPCVLEDVARGFKVVKAFRIATAGDLADALDYLAQCRPHAALIDARVEGQRGGTGQAAPWSLVAPMRTKFWPLILGGGLNPENVAEAVRLVQPYAVESSSGVERAPGQKDPDLVRNFVRAALSVSIEYPQIGDEHEI